ncbi:DUF459 domain-containing protein [Aquabacter sp. L1I39]|uniref:SGNH/GDSL hydrolase family protein n=1 Tax=Aquabacter sp. L1I39 TaxID=2820278 RepID=UPI001ADA795A|nr:GDSL-type esterase/lipase family protein [Aquabacter sp. L1I39]QTL01827.1 DUF459 domain-containing protein [Aquabacter sp. L1I39]
MAWVAVAAAILFGAALAQAQDLRPPGSIPRPPANVGGGGGGLFGGWNPFAPLFPPPQQQPQQQVQPQAPKPPPEPEGTVYSSAEEAVQGKKQPPTKFVLVIGDRLGAQFAKGLADSYVTEKGSPAVIARTDDDSGYLPGETSDVTDWMAKWPEAVSAARPGVTVVALGSNDIHPIRDGDTLVEPFTDRWNELYGKRMDDLLAALRARAGNVVVVGLAPVQNPATMADYERLNDILKSHAAKAGIIFANVWDGFVDEDGKYTASGAAVDGQRRRLRLNDGVRFTRAGGRKLAFFAQKDIARILSEVEQMPDAGPGDGTRGPMSLNDRPRGSSLLAGGTTAQPVVVPAAANAGESVKALKEGLPLTPPAGRADDFSWPPRTPAATAVPAAGSAPGDK